MSSSIVFTISGGLLFISFLLSFLRFKLGPDPLDRVIALDLMGIFAISVLGLFSIYFDTEMFLDIAIVFALVSFVTALAFGSFFLKKKDEK